MLISPDIAAHGIVTPFTHPAARWLPNNFTLVSATNWPTANKAYYVPVLIREPTIVKKVFWINGTAASGNVDTGIYDFVTKARLYSTGSTARSGTSVPQYATLTNPILLKPGLYLIGHSSDTTTNSRTVYYDLVNAISADTFGASQQTSAFALPDPAVPAVQATNFLFPFVGFYTSRNGA